MPQTRTVHARSPGDLTYRAASDLNGEELEELAALAAEHGKVTAPLIVVRE